MEINIYHDTINSYWNDWFLYLAYLKYNQYKNANIANFVYYGKTRLDIFFSMVILTTAVMKTFRLELGCSVWLTQSHSSLSERIPHVHRCFYSIYLFEEK